MSYAYGTAPDRREMIALLRSEVFDRPFGPADVPDSYRAMNDREAITVLIEC